MTRSQFAAAAMAEDKWVENSARLLGRKLKYTASEARWLGLVRLLSQEQGVPLARAAELADEAVRFDPSEDWIVVGQTENGVSGISIDLARFHSDYAASLSAAKDMGARRRGRSRAERTAALESAAKYGVDIGLLKEGLRLSVKERLQRLDENAGFIYALHPAKRKS